MSEYIERESIRKSLMQVCSDENCPMFIAATIDQMIDYEPAADVAPVVHGKWIRIDDPEFICGDFECSNCSHREYDVDTDELMPGENCLLYCPNCGAKMDEEDC